MTMPADNAQDYSVSELSQAIKRTVETSFDFVRVRGEISRPTYARSGHLYFTLKDEKAVLDVVCWKGAVSRLSTQAEEGLEIIAQGKLTTYPGSSKYQLVMESMEAAGEGALLKLLEDRKKKFAAEGLFDPDSKQSLPFLPRRIGVVTSPTGAVIRDIIHRISDRFPLHLMLWPVKVQGEGAADQVAKAIVGFNNLDQNLRPDLLIVGRGGGSLEDLWAFNEEVVVRAIASSDIPIISAVGHETDTTLSDFVADLRAPTPTGAAEQAVPVRRDLIAVTQDLGARMLRGAAGLTGRKTEYLSGLSRGLMHPERALELAQQRLDQASSQLDQALASKVQTQQILLERAVGGLRHPRDLLRGAQDRVGQYQQRLSQATPKVWLAAKRRLTELQAQRRATASLANTFGRGEQNLERTWGLLTAYQEMENRALARGYARVQALDGSVLTTAEAMRSAGSAQLIFSDGGVQIQSTDASSVETDKISTTLKSKKTVKTKPDAKPEGGGEPPAQGFLL